jgi:organic radical activating enzyme
LWKSQCILPGGHVSPCCHASLKKEWKNVKYHDGIVTREHELARDLMRKDKWPDICSTCRENEKDNITSARQKALLFFGNQSEKVELEYLDIKFSNLCNLACRMCNATSSSKIEDLYSNDDVNDIPDFLKYSVQSQASNIFEDEYAKAEYVKECISSGLKHLKVTGGEPFASKPFLEVINWCIDTGYSKDLGLSITTNGTKYNERLLSKLVEFKYVSTVVSVDGTHNIYNYIRQGSNWDKLQENLDNFDSFFQDKKEKLRFNNNSIHIAIILQFYNVFDISNLIGWCIERNYRPKVDVNLKPNDSELSVKFLPWYIKKAVIHDLSHGLQSHQNSDWACSQIQNVIDYLESTKDLEDKNKNEELKRTILKQDMKYHTKFEDFLDQRQIEFLNGINT